MLGKQSLQFVNKPYIIGSGSIVGSKEAEGPMGKLFDKIGYDDKFGADTWEDAESSLQKEALEIALSMAGIKKQDLQVVYAGDLLGQSIASSFGLSGYQVPHVGLYGACSTCGLSLTMGSMAIAGAFVEKTACITSSHFASAEKEFRFPLAYGNQRPKSATWTVTGSGAFILSAQPGSRTRAVISGATIGKIVDYGLKDSMNMGACMAPADSRIEPWKENGTDTMLTLLHTSESYIRIRLVLYRITRFENQPALKYLYYFICLLIVSKYNIF